MAKKRASKRISDASTTFTHIPAPELPKLLEQLIGLGDPEIVLIKAHVLVERVLTQALAARLRTVTESVPRLPYGVLVDLAARHESRKKLIWFNDLRNVLAHEFDPLENVNFVASIGKFGIKWPSHARLRLSISKALGQYVVVLAFREVLYYLFVQLSLQRRPSLPNDAKQVGEIYSSLTPLLDEFDDLVNRLATAGLTAAPVRMLPW